MAQKVDQSVSVSKETLELYKAIEAMLLAGKVAKDAGLSGAALIASIAAAGLAPLATAIDGISGVAVEANEDLPEFIAAHGVGAGMVGAAIVKLTK